MNRQARCLNTYSLAQNGMMENFWLKEQLVLEYSRVNTRAEDKLSKGFFEGGNDAKKPKAHQTNL